MTSSEQPRSFPKPFYLLTFNRLQDGISITLTYTGHILWLRISVLKGTLGFVIVQTCLTFCNPTDCSTPGFPVLHHLLELAQTRVHWVGDAFQSSHPLCPFLLFSIFPSIRVFSNESALRNRWPKFWSFSFIISPSNEYSGLISFRIDWLDLLTVQGIQQMRKLRVRAVTYVAQGFIASY